MLAVHSAAGASPTMGSLGVDAPGLKKKKCLAHKYSATEISGPVLSLLGVDCKVPRGSNGNCRNATNRQPYGREAKLAP